MNATHSTQPAGGKAMTAKRILKAKHRKSNGSSMAEFGPGLFILLICIFFPLVDLLSICVSYGLCMVLNYNQVHEASLIPWNDADDANGTVKKAIVEQWEDGMGRFVKRSGEPVTVISYSQGETGSDQITDRIVTVSTTVVCNPFLPIPLPMVNVPGMNGPMTFCVVANRPMENPDYAKP